MSGTETGRIDHRKFAEWVGLNGPKPDDHALAMYLESTLGNREEVDSIEAAVTIEAANALRDRAALRAVATEWLAFAEERYGEFDLEPCDRADAEMCPKCKEVGCITAKINNTRTALGIAKDSGQ